MLISSKAGNAFGPSFSRVDKASFANARSSIDGESIFINATTFGRRSLESGPILQIVFKAPVFILLSLSFNRIPISLEATDVSFPQVARASRRNSLISGNAKMIFSLITRASVAPRGGFKLLSTEKANSRTLRFGSEQASTISPIALPSRPTFSNILRQAILMFSCGSLNRIFTSGARTLALIPACKAATKANS